MSVVDRSCKGAYEDELGGGGFRLVTGTKADSMMSWLAFEGYNKAPTCVRCRPHPAPTCVRCRPHPAPTLSLLLFPKAMLRWSFCKKKTRLSICKYP
jgi:hypothetical protein